MSYTFRGFLPDLTSLANKMPALPTGPAAAPSTLAPSSGYFQELLEDVAKDLPTQFPSETYTPPAATTAPTAPTDKTGSKVGLAIAIGVGVLALAGVIWFVRR